MRPVTAMIILAALAQVVDAQPKDERNVSSQMFLLEDSNSQQWCEFRSQVDWKAQVQSRSATAVATVEYAKGKLSAVRVTEESESGDWIVYDEYSVSDGRLIRLLRKMNILSGSLSVGQTFRFRGGQAVLEKTTTRDLKSGNPAKVSDIDLPEVPITTELHNFPFFALIKDQLGSSNKKESCVPDTP